MTSIGLFTGYATYPRHAASATEECFASVGAFTVFFRSNAGPRSDPTRHGSEAGQARLFVHCRTTFPSHPAPSSVFTSQYLSQWLLKLVFTSFDLPLLKVLSYGAFFYLDTTFMTRLFLLMLKPVFFEFLFYNLIILNAFMFNLILSLLLLTLESQLDDCLVVSKYCVTDAYFFTCFTFRCLIKDLIVYFQPTKVEK